ncbi:MAG: TatD family hydrolase, partial [Bacilli bacterium]|nr:TatD family hydrolase [Bacilli bacterium]
MFTDTHCHIFSEYYNNIDEIITNAKNVGISRVINNGCNHKSNIEVLSLIEKYPNMYGAIGIHPEEVETYKKEDIDFLKANLNNPKIVAIGEIGLDYHYTKENKEEQIKLFEIQLKIAEELHLPVIVHSRDATEDTINI